MIRDRHAEGAADAAVGLESISLGEWTGEAADAFRERFGDVSPDWWNASDSMPLAAAALESYADALESYADALTAAQSRADYAVQQWDHGQQLTQAAVDWYHAAQERGTIVGSFTDPGQSWRDAAQRTLSDARDSVEQAGDAAAATVGEQADHAPTSPSFWSKVGDGAGNVLAGTVNAVASVGNAMIHHPESVVEIGLPVTERADVVPTLRVKDALAAAAWYEQLGFASAPPAGADRRAGTARSVPSGSMGPTARRVRRIWRCWSRNSVVITGP